MSRVIKYCFFLKLLISSFSANGQQLVFNTADSIYYLSDGRLCTTAVSDIDCLNGIDSELFSVAMHKEFLYVYVLTRRAGVLYKVNLKNPKECTLIKLMPPSRSGEGPALNSMATDKNGVVYFVNINTVLSRFNPSTGIYEELGQVPHPPGGDIIFYKEKLLLATNGYGIWEINIESPMDSELYMDTEEYSFFGMVAVPFNCKENKYYGLAVNMFNFTDWVELDLENKKIGAIECYLPYFIYDAASNVEDGNTIGITVNSIQVNGDCKDNTVGIKVLGSTAVEGVLTYTLGDTNTTGIFSGVAAGEHKLSVTNERGCSLDTVITIAPLLSGMKLLMEQPYSCEIQDGRIEVVPLQGTAPFSFRVNDRELSSGIFENMGSGRYSISITDALGCRIDSVIVLKNKVLPGELPVVEVFPVLCNSNYGGIKVLVPDTNHYPDLKVSLNDNPVSTALEYDALREGYYNITLFYGNNCRYDTTVLIERVKVDTPELNFEIIHQQCLEDNGAFIVQADGANKPYLVSVNESGFQDKFTYSGLSAGLYTIQVRDAKNCTFDTTLIINPYLPAEMDVVIEVVMPVCSTPSSGSITVNIPGGGVEPLRYRYKNDIYDIGSTVAGLSAGEHEIQLLNADGCPVALYTVNLELRQTPECDLVFVPNAFSPDNDGKNDYFFPRLGAGVSHFEFLVFNRWGEIIYSASERSRGWNGHFNGMPQPSGIYGWSLTYRTITPAIEKRLKGTLLLIR